eukprot:g15285.t1
MAKWHAVLIANNGPDLKHALRDAKLVARALVRCGFCERKEDVHLLLNQTRNRIKKKLEQVIDSLASDAQLFVCRKRWLREDKDKGDFPGDVFLKMLQELGFYFTARKYENKLAVCDEDKVIQKAAAKDALAKALQADVSEEEPVEHQAESDQESEEDTGIGFKKAGSNQDKTKRRRVTKTEEATESTVPEAKPKPSAASGSKRKATTTSGPSSDLAENGEEAAEWQVRVVNNYRDLEDHDWLNPHCNVDLHFVQSPHWPTLPWKKPELLERLKTFADRRPQSQVLHAVAFLIHAIQKDPEWKVVKACGAAAQTGAEVDEEGRSALHRAAFNGEIDEVERLLRAGLDIEAKDNRVDTPLHLAAGYGHLTVVDRLIAAGAVLEATGRFGATPLHWAAVAGHWEVAQRLIEARADLEAKDHSGRTPLHRAAEECYWEVAQRLIEARADLKVRDKQGQTPWHFAKKNGWKKMIGVLHPVQVGKLRSGRTVPCDLKDRRTVHGLQEDFQWRATELLKKKTEELYVLIPKMVDLFEGIDDTKMERLAEQLVEMMEVSTDEFHFLMTSFENCLQGQKIRVSDDEFRDMMDLVHLDQLLAQVKKHQERRQVVEDELESSAEGAYSEVDEVSDIEKNEQGAGVPQVICLAMLAIGL